MLITPFKTSKGEPHMTITADTASSYWTGQARPVNYNGNNDKWEKTTPIRIVRRSRLERSKWCCYFGAAERYGHSCAPHCPFLALTASPIYFGRRSSEEQRKQKPLWENERENLGFLVVRIGTNRTANRKETRSAVWDQRIFLTEYVYKMCCKWPSHISFQLGVHSRRQLKQSVVSHRESNTVNAEICRRWGEERKELEWCILNAQHCFVTSSTSKCHFTLRALERRRQRRTKLYFNVITARPFSTKQINSIKKVTCPVMALGSQLFPRCCFNRQNKAPRGGSREKPHVKHMFYCD